jgi:hypothetical protein
MALSIESGSPGRQRAQRQSGAPACMVIGIAVCQQFRERLEHARIVLFAHERRRSHRVERNPTPTGSSTRTSTPFTKTGVRHGLRPGKQDTSAGVAPAHQPLHHEVGRGVHGQADAVGRRRPWPAAGGRRRLFVEQLSAERDEAITMYVPALREALAAPVV